MPISDLLASITGEAPSPVPIPTPRLPAVVPKRKAEDDLGRTPAKAQRTESLSNGSSRPPNGNPPNPASRPADKPHTGSADRSTSAPRPPVRTLSSSSQISTPAPSRSGSGNASSANAREPLPSRPLARRPTDSESGPKPQPKKRSFQEIMARAAANAPQREAFGKIQHKTVEKGTSLKERREMKAGEARMERRATRNLPSGKNGAGNSSRRDGPSTTTNQRNGALSKKPAPAANAKQKTPPVEEKKVKKAALATIGYTGTARGVTRPRPSASAVTASTTKARAPSRLVSAAKPPRYGGALSTSRRHDDVDEEMDDFIEYDEDEDDGFGNGYGRRPGGYNSYDEEDESDMEAAGFDIEEEERRAEALARKEDREQEALERRLKEEKERKRRLAGR
ncbi:hypothetical protein B0H63DRAFT_301185 [Podospora didyma]|uniref:SPT2 chromatin protein n=1 Tax=Podospora didyma TaxID=330526 RepID=A0AAE0N6G7_9PEZI|nr:hypothetical protein B0H63DRAFT_301185 [Podospora didyma]